MLQEQINNEYENDKNGKTGCYILSYIIFDIRKNNLDYFNE